MKRILLISIALFFIIGCSKNDPNDPQTWVKKLDNPKTQEEAIYKLGELKSKDGLPRLMDILKEDNNRVAPKALKSIIQIGDEAKILEAIKIGANSKHRSVSTLSINTIKTLDKKSDAMLQIIVDSITAPEQFTKEAAIIAAGELKIKTAVDPLIKVLTDLGKTQHIVLNKQAAIALSKIKDPKAIKPLIKALFIVKNNKANKGGTFAVARDALVNFGKKALDELLLTIDGKNEDFNEFKKNNPKLKQSDIDYNFLVMIGEMGSKEQLSVLVKYMNHDDLGVRMQAVAAMGMLNIQESVPILLKKYYILKKKIKKIKDLQELQEPLKEITNINRMLAMIGGKKAHDHVIKEALKGDIKIDGEKYPDVRIDAAQSLSNFAGHKYYEDYQKLWSQEKDATLKKTFEYTLKIMEITNKCKDDPKCYIKIIETKTKRKEAFERQKAAYMLRNYDTPEVKKAIFEKAIIDKDPGVRQAATSVLEKIGTKDDAVKVDKLINLTKKKTHLKKSRSLFKKLKMKLLNR